LEFLVTRTYAAPNSATNFTPNNVAIYSVEREGRAERVSMPLCACRALRRTARPRLRPAGTGITTCHHTAGESILCYKSRMARNGRRSTLVSDPDEARRAAVQDEPARFNAACARRGPAPLQTAAGLQLVWQVTPDWWYVCGPDDLTASSLPGRNDEAWAALMAGVGEPRHPLLVKRLLSRNGRRRP